MSYYPTINPQDDELKRGLDAVRQTGAALLERERQEAEAQERQAQAAVDARLQMAEARALELYRECAPIYERRAHAAAKLKGPLAEFWAAEGELREKSAIIGEVLAELRSRIDPLAYRRHLEQLRAAANIPDHSDIWFEQAPSTEDGQIAQTVTQGIVKGHIGAGYIRVGSMIMRFGNTD